VKVKCSAWGELGVFKSGMRTIAETLIFVEGDASFDGRPMNFRMEKTLRFWVHCSYEDQRYENSDRTKNELIAGILRDYERSGHAMRYLNVKGQIAWKLPPACVHY
jgi:hypothetical protein